MVVHKSTQASEMLGNMKAKVSFALAQSEQIAKLAKSSAWDKLTPIDQEMYAAENTAWRTVARIVNIRMKIEIGRMARKAEQRTGGSRR